MKKIFLGGPGACGVHNEKNELEDYIWLDESLELVDDYKKADLIIIIDTCMGTYPNLEESINYLKDVLLAKKDNARVIVSGCLIKNVNFELPKDWKEVLEKVEKVSSSKIREYVLEILEFDIDEELKSALKMPAISFLDHGIQFSPVSGCLNHCSFCKANYMDFSLKSNHLENIKLMVKDIDRLPEDNSVNFINIHSSNLSLYGVDLYGEPKTHELLNILFQPDTVKFISAGALINWYPLLLKEILNNPKIKTIFISLESGSERIYNLMNRPITLTKLTEIIKTIRENRPDIIINTEIICGFPTETKDDLNRSIELIQELDINPLFGNSYINSSQIPSSRLSQHSPEYCMELTNYSKKLLQPQMKKYNSIINNRELLVIDKNPYIKMYKVMLIDGNIRYIRFDQFDKEYNINDMIPTNSSNKSRILQKNI